MSYSFGIDPPPPSPPPAPPADASAAGPTASDKAIAGVVIVGVVGFLGFILYTNYKIASAIAEREGSEGLIKYELGSAAIGIGSEMAYRGMRQNSHKRGRRALGAPVGNVHYGRFTKAEASAFRRGKLRKQIAKAKREGRDVTFREFFRPGVYEELFGSEREGT